MAAAAAAVCVPETKVEAAAPFVLDGICTSCYPWDPETAPQCTRCHTPHEEDCDKKKCVGCKQTYCRACPEVEDGDYTESGAWACSTCFTSKEPCSSCRDHSAQASVKYKCDGCARLYCGACPEAKEGGRIIKTAWFCSKCDKSLNFGCVFAKETKVFFAWCHSRLKRYSPVAVPQASEAARLVACRAALQVALRKP